MRPTRKIFGSKLKLRRESLYLTQFELGKLVDLKEKRIASIEQSEVAGIDPARIPRFAAALKLTPEGFLKDVGAPDGFVASAKTKRVPLITPAISLAALRWLSTAATGDEQQASVAELPIDGARRLIDLLSQHVVKQEQIIAERRKQMVEAAAKPPQPAPPTPIKMPKPKQPMRGTGT